MTEEPVISDPRPTLRLGSYLLLQQLGSGGMSSVFRAVHEETGNIVALKVLPTNLAKNLTLLQRFLREAKSAEALDHPNIVTIYDRGFDRGRHYLVLEHVEGGDLHDRVKKLGPLTIPDALHVLRQTSEGLHYAAGLGMIHRDIKPANLLLDPEGKTKIIDLGLALQLSDEDERVTRDGTTVGTVDYMAPEQARDSRKTSERSDIYSLGCTFHYLLTGSPPYPGGNLADKLTRHVTAPVADPRTLKPDLPEPLAWLAMRMMAKNPDERFANYEHLIRSIDYASSTLSQTFLRDAIIDDEEGPHLQEIVEERSTPNTDYSLAELVELEDSSTGPSTNLAGSTRPVVSLAELASLDREADPTHLAPVTKPSRPSLAEILGEDDSSPPMDSPLIQRTADDLPLQTWIVAGIMVGIAVAILGAITIFLAAQLSKSRAGGQVASPSHTSPTEAPTAIEPDDIDSPPLLELKPQPQPYDQTHFNWSKPQAWKVS